MDQVAGECMLRTPFHPRNKEIYERNYSVFKKLYKDNADNFKALNA